MNDEEMMMNAAGPSKPSSSTTISPDHRIPDEPPAGMSKSAAKRAAKKAYREATKTAFRAQERAKQKEKKTALMQEFRAGTLDEEGRARVEKRIELARLKRKQKAGADVNEKQVWKGGVVVDLGFDELMTDREIASLSQQVAYVYASNRTASRPVSALLYTSVSPTASPQLWPVVVDKGCSQWHRCYWWGESVDDLAHVFGLERRPRSPPPSQAPHGLADVESSGGSGVKRKLDTPEVNTTSDGEPRLAEPIATSSQVQSGLDPDDEMDDQAADTQLGRAAVSSLASAPNLASVLPGPNLPSAWSSESQQLVYLSADADEELQTLKEDEIYILGGLVDKNRYKLLCENKARSLGIRTARLPIGSYIADLPTRKVLTVNQTFDILLKYIELNDWAQAFHTVIPQRKFAAKGKRALLKERSKARAEMDPVKADGQIETSLNA